MTPDRAALLALTVFAVVLAVVLGWLLTADRRRARRIVRGLRATTGAPAYPIPGDAAVCAANRLDLTPTLRRTEEQALERLFALPAKEIR
jgi:hypothetical protein